MLDKNNTETRGAKQLAITTSKLFYSKNPSTV